MPWLLQNIYRSRLPRGTWHITLWYALCLRPLGAKIDQSREKLCGNFSNFLKTLPSNELLNSEYTTCQRRVSSFDAAINYSYNEVLTEYLSALCCFYLLQSFDKLFSIQSKHDKHLVSLIVIGKLNTLWFISLISTLLLSWWKWKNAYVLFLARNNILLKQPECWTEYILYIYILIFTFIICLYM